MAKITGKISFTFVNKRVQLFQIQSLSCDRWPI